MLVLLDSTVLIDFLRGRPAMGRVLALGDSGDVPATSAINLEEIVRGTRPGEREAVEALAAGLAVLSVDSDIAWLAGDWRRGFAARGIILHQADCLVAATARVNAARLCTGNPKDFPMDGVHVEHWPVGR